MRTVLTLLCSILFYAAPASANEVDLQLGAEGQATSWEGDGVAYSSLSVSYFFERWLAADFTGKFGLVAGFALRTNITPVERMTHIWREDPAIRRLPSITMSVVPLNGGAFVGVGGSF